MRYSSVSVTTDLPMKCSPNFRANGADSGNGVEKKVVAHTLTPNLLGDTLAGSELSPWADYGPDLGRDVALLTPVKKRRPGQDARTR